MPFPKVKSHELGDQQCRALRSPPSRARRAMTAAHSSGSGEQMFGAE